MSSSDSLEVKQNKKKAKPLGLELDLAKLKNSKDFEKDFYELFRYAFITNCHLDEASVTGEELETLEELSTEEILENFKDLVKDLLNFKKEYKSSDKAELAQRSEQFENMLQKLEAEIRNHIRIEHQLKLHIESNQNKIEELERLKQETDEKLQNFESKNKEKKGPVEVSKDKLIQKFEVECNKLKLLLEDKIKECEKLKKEIDCFKASKNGDKSTASIEVLRKKLEEKAIEITKIHNMTKEKEKPLARSIDRRKKKSADENVRNSPSPFRMKKEGDGCLADSRPSTAKKTPSKTHARSNSDQTRTLIGKKMII